MYHILIEWDGNANAERVLIGDENGEIITTLPGRVEAVGWLVNAGCCPGAAKQLIGAIQGVLYEIASPDGTTSEEIPA